jgi:hypothetical protein
LLISVSPSWLQHFAGSQAPKPEIRFLLNTLMLQFDLQKCTTYTDTWIRWHIVYVRQSKLWCRLIAVIQWQNIIRIRKASKRKKYVKNINHFIKKRNKYDRYVGWFRFVKNLKLYIFINAGIIENVSDIKYDFFEHTCVICANKIVGMLLFRSLYFFY